MIGAGIFGLHISVELAKKGVPVTLMEQNNQILNETTANSILRVHSGLHYPRDLETATQSQRGYIPFSNYYGEVIRSGFPNYYGLSSLQSKSTRNQLSSLVIRANIPAKRVDLDEIAFTGINTSFLDSVWKVDEAVVDLTALRDFYEKLIINVGVNCLLNHKVTELDQIGNNWIAKAENGYTESFTNVVRATHGQDNLKSNILRTEEKIYEFHETKMLRINSTNNQFGMTVLDGNFISFLPVGFSSDFFIYGPGVSIRQKYTGSMPPVSWSQSSESDDKKFIHEATSLFKHWFPNFPNYKLVGIVSAIRSVQPGVAITDRRVSEVREVAHNIIDIKSTKIDHVVEISDLIVKNILCNEN